MAQLISETACVPQSLHLHTSDAPAYYMLRVRRLSLLRASLSPRLPSSSDMLDFLTRSPTEITGQPPAKRPCNGEGEEAMQRQAHENDTGEDPTAGNEHRLDEYCYQEEQPAPGTCGHAPEQDATEGALPLPVDLGAVAESFCFRSQEVRQGVVKHLEFYRDVLKQARPSCAQHLDLYPYSNSYVYDLRRWTSYSLVSRTTSSAILSE